MAVTRKALWLKHDAHFGEHPKTLRLRRLAGRQADSAECGWWRIVEGAKRYGEWTFDSEEHLEHVAGPYARYVPLYREVGMLDSLTIHNGDEYQAPLSGAERVALHRDRSNADSVTRAVTPVTPREEKSREDKSRAETPARPMDLHTRDGLIHVTPLVAESWVDATGVTLLGSGVFAQNTVDDACRRHPEAKVIEAVYRARSTFDHIPAASAMAAALRNDLDPFPDKKQSKEQDAERREAERGRRAVQATKKRTHDLGYHADEPDPMCDACKGGKAA